jgi:hypothetical protein
LDYAAKGADGACVVRAAGVESEMEFTFAALHQFCLPLLDGLESLPLPQRETLGTAFTLSSGQPPARFLVGLAVLNKPGQRNRAPLSIGRRSRLRSRNRRSLAQLANKPSVSVDKTDSRSGWSSSPGSPETPLDEGILG